MNNLKISVIIPMYNETAVLEKSIYKIISMMEIAIFDYEIILIDDCSSDGTIELAKKIAANQPKVKFFAHKKNMGRGTCVADGIRMSSGLIVGFIDIDLSSNPAYIPYLVHNIIEGVDVATARRIYKLHLRSTPRWIVSKGYNLLFRLIIRINFRDTETGCKFFKKDRIVPILDIIEDEHWFWDTEIMVWSYLEGLKVKEVDTLFVRNGHKDSTVRLFRDSLIHFINLFRLAKRVRLYLKTKNNFIEHKRLYCSSMLRKIWFYLKWHILPMIKIEKIMPRKGSLLDIGCGEGIISSYLALCSTERKVFGIDWNGKRIISTLNMTRNLKNLNFVKGDASEELPKHNNISGIILSDFLHHIDYSSQEHLLKLAYECMNDDATLLLKEIDKGYSLRFFFSFLADHILYFKGRVYFRSRQQWKDVLKRTGYSVEDEPAHKSIFSTVLYTCTKGK